MNPMVLLGKIALGFGAGVLLMGAYTFREGVIRVDADENRPNGSHVHFWVPATIVPMAMHFVPKGELAKGGEQARQCLPLLRAVAKELAKYPEAQLVEVQDGAEHAVVRTHNGSLHVDVDSPDEHVHVKVPLETLDDVARTLAEAEPPA